MNEIAEVLAGRRRWACVLGDCLDVLPELPARCVDLVLTEGSPACKWAVASLELR